MTYAPQPPTVYSFTSAVIRLLSARCGEKDKIKRLWCKQMNACYMCNNAHTDSSLNSNNDLSYIGVGKCLKDYSMDIRSGDNRPTAIVLQHWNELLKQNVTVAEYAVSYCPNCGRKIFENDVCK